MATKRDWLARYRAGQRGRVWHGLRQLGEAVRDPDMRAEVQLVCDEMARRARHNIDVIVEHLVQDGFRFHTNDDKQTPVTPHIPPTAAAAEHADWLEQRFGPVPMTLLSWRRLVGDVWLVGTHPHWPTSASADPLVVQGEGPHHPDHSIRNFFADEWEQWHEHAKNNPQVGQFVLSLAPDRLHKENVSGGSPYGIRLPDGCADGLLGAEICMPFVEYRNRAFQRAGVPAFTGSGTNEWKVTYARGQRTPAAVSPRSVSIVDFATRQDDARVLLRTCHSRSRAAASGLSFSSA